MKNKTTIEYNKEVSRISLCNYEDDFLLSDINITEAVLTLALEKLYDDYGLEDDDELHIKKKKSLNSVTKIELKK